MPLYTLVADYEGGTYVSQVIAPDANSAIVSWAENLDVKAIPHLDVKARTTMVETLRQDEENGVGHTPLKGLSNVWFFCVGVRNNMMYVTFVQTAQANPICKCQSRCRKSSTTT